MDIKEEHVHTHEDGTTHIHADGTVHTHEDGATHVHADGTVHTHEDGTTHVHADGTVHTHEDGTMHVHEDGTVHSHTHPHTHQNTKTVKNRLARVIGHLHAVERMIDDGRDCSEVLIQLAAVRSALNNICKLILRDHMDHCVIDAIRSGETDTLSELDKAIDLLMK